MKLAEDYTMGDRDVRAAINRIEENMTYVRHDITCLRQRMNDCIPRRDFSKAVKQQLVRVVRERYHSGRCPCCHKVTIIDDNGGLIRGQAHFDHFKGREHNGLEDGWLVCQECNSRLENDDEFKQRRRSHFEVFHDHRRDLCSSAVLRSRRRKPSGTTTDQRQARLFD